MVSRIVGVRLGCLPIKCGRHIRHVASYVASSDQSFELAWLDRLDSRVRRSRAERGHWRYTGTATGTANLYTSYRRFLGFYAIFSAVHPLSPGISLRVSLLLSDPLLARQEN